MSHTIPLRNHTPHWEHIAKDTTCQLSEPTPLHGPLKNNMSASIIPWHTPRCTTHRPAQIHQPYHHSLTLSTRPYHAHVTAMTYISQVHCHRREPLRPVDVRSQTTPWRLSTSNRPHTNGRIQRAPTPQSDREPTYPSAGKDTCAHVHASRGTTSPRFAATWRHRTSELHSQSGSTL